MTDQIRVMIADDHPMFRKGLTVLIKSLSRCEVVAEAEDGASVVQLALQHEPDVILMDVRMPELNGIEATRQIFKQCPRIGILILTMFQDDDLVLAAMKAGARGYLLKGADQDEIIRAIETVKNGGAIFSPSIADRMMNYFSSIKPVRADGLFPELTEREIEVLDLIAKGYNNTDIAEQLVLSNKTVRNHVSNILSKLQAADRSEAIRLAWSSGLGQRDNSDLR